MKKVGIDPRWMYCKKVVDLVKLKRGTAILNTTIMSWSISFIGRPEKVVEALEGYVEKSGMSGPSKEEYEKALPLMVGLVKQNFGNEGELVQVTANGSGTYVNEEPKNSRCNVKIDNIWGVLV